MNTYIQCALGAAAAAIAAAIPALEGGLSTAEVLSIVLAGIAGTGLTAVVPSHAKR